MSMRPADCPTLFLLFLVLLSPRCCSAGRRIGPLLRSQQPVVQRMHKPRHNVSQLLDKLLDDYNHHLRPDFGGPPSVVDVDIMVRSMGPISESDMTFSLDCYFRQTWRDTRLAHESSSSDEDLQLSLSVSMLDRIWKPDTYFYNGKNSYVHTITTPNKLVRLFPDGRILYSSRLTIKASCPMELRNFPMDVQVCPLNLGSFAYTQSEVMYRWNKVRQIVIAPGMKMSQFDLVSTPISNYTLRFKHGNCARHSLSIRNDLKCSALASVTISPTGNYSMLSVGFSLHRHMGSFLIQVYGPCMLLVVLSWVSFWLNREATADRVSLGVTTVLTMTFLGLEARAALPKVAYPTALDYFIFLTFGFIFATIVQFAFVHYFTKIGFGEVYFSFDGDDHDDGHITDEEPPQPASTASPGAVRKARQVHPQQQVFSVEHHLMSLSEKQATVVHIQTGDPSPSGQKLPESKKTNRGKSQRWDGRSMNSVSQIDQVSRVVFPILFVTINLFYWYTYIPPS